jgi:hypothetical protein
MLVFATAEPFGSYHLAPMMKHFEHNLTHLIPNMHEHLEQRRGFVPVTEDTRVLETAKAVVITGGTIVEWTHSVATMAHEMGLPVYYLEVATIGVDVNPAFPIRDIVSHAFVGSELSKEIIARNFGLNQDDISVIGYPFLDSFDVRTDINTPPQRILLASTVQGERDRQRGELRNMVHMLKANTDIEVIVRPHPREDLTFWEGVKLSHGHLEDDLNSVDGVISIPGTMNLAVAASGLPLWHLAGHENDETRSMAELSQAVPSVSQISEELASPQQRDTNSVERIVGPLDSGAILRLRDALL